MVNIVVTGTTITHDETAELQNSTATPSPAGDADDNDVLFSSIPGVFSTRLGQLTSATALGAAGSPGNVVTFSDLTGTFNIALTDADGNPLFNDDSGLVTTGGDAIFLFTDTNDNIVLGKTSSGTLVFAIYLEETGGSPPTGAKLWTVQYEAIDHGDDNNDPDSAVDLTDLVYVTASAEQSFPFAGAPSGQNLFMMFGTTSQAILVTGEDPANESAGQNVSNDGDTVNTGQGGGATTLGTEGQQIKAQKALVVTFVSGADPNLLVPNLSPGEATDESKIAFTDYVLARDAEFTISQMTPGNSNTTATVELAAYLTADAAGDLYIDNDPLVTGDAPINITTGSVQVFRDGVNVVGTQGVTVNYAGDTAVITGVKDDDIISYSTDADHNRVLIRNDQPASGKGSNVAFDLGGFKITQDSGDTKEVGSKIFFEDDGPTVTVSDASGTYAAGATDGTWDHDPGTDGFVDGVDSLGVTFDSYELDSHGSVTATATNSTFTQTGDFAFEGSITDDFNGDGTDETVDFTLTFNPDDTYDLQVTTPPDTVTTFDTSQGTLKAGGPDAVQTLLFGGSEAGADDIVFFGAVATAPPTGGSGGTDDILDLVVSGAPDLTESQIETSFPIANLINPSTQMNVSTSGIGVNNNNLNGASQGSGTGIFAGTTITAGDESFVVNPETVVDRVTVFIDNSVSGYNPATEDLYYTVYYTDGTVSAPTRVTAGMLDPVTTGVAKGGVSFDIDGGLKQIDAVQLTMGEGTIKIPVIAFSVEQVFAPEPLHLDFTATLVDVDGDSHQDTFSVDLTP
jgi:hypothetical protein